MARKLSTFLSSENIQKIKDDLNTNYRGKIQKEITDRAMSDIRTRGVDIIKEEIGLALSIRNQNQDAKFTGNLMNSVVADGKMGSNRLTLRVEAPYGAYVEFGTGVIGRNSKISSSYISQHGWKHDVNRHGLLGWFYYDEIEGILRWTQGQEATSFMLNSAALIRKEVTRLLVNYSKEGASK